MRASSIKVIVRDESMRKIDAMVCRLGDKEDEARLLKKLKEKYGFMEKEQEDKETDILSTDEGFLRF